MRPRKQLPAVPERLVLAADADRRTIERELHSGVHQYLVALATTLQLARRAADSDPAAFNALLDEMERDVRRALDEASLLAQRIYPSALELGGLAALLRSAAVQAGVPATVDVAADSSYAPEIALTVYLCWLAALASGKSETQVTIGVGEVDGTLSFEIAAEALGADFDRLRDRVEALGGSLAIESAPGGIRLSGSLPLRK
jgi:signal transduction histidine kinase